jgi:hypothetical protein
MPPNHKRKFLPLKIFLSHHHPRPALAFLPSCKRHPTPERKNSFIEKTLFLFLKIFPPPTPNRRRKTFNTQSLCLTPAPYIPLVPSLAPSHLLRLRFARNQKDALNKSLNNQPHETEFFTCFAHLERIAFLKKSHAKIFPAENRKRARHPPPVRNLNFLFSPP